MVPPTFTVVPDARNAFLHLTLVGDWDQPTAERFAAAVADAIRGMIAAGARPGEFLTLIDMSWKNIVPQNVAAELAKMVRPDSPSRRIAMIVSGALHALQAKRVNPGDIHRVFASEEAARAWLFDDGGLSSPPA